MLPVLFILMQSREVMDPALLGWTGCTVLRMHSVPRLHAVTCWVESVVGMVLSSQFSECTTVRLSRYPCDGGLYPGIDLCHRCVHTGVSLPGTAHAPGHDADLKVSVW